MCHTAVDSLPRRHINRLCLGELASDARLCVSWSLLISLSPLASPRTTHSSLEMPKLLQSQGTGCCSSGRLAIQRRWRQRVHLHELVSPLTQQHQLMDCCMCGWKQDQQQNGKQQQTHLTTCQVRTLATYSEFFTTIIGIYALHLSHTYMHLPALVKNPHAWLAHCKWSIRTQYMCVDVWQQ